MLDNWLARVAFLSNLWTPEMMEPARLDSEPPRLLVMGAHPDDAEAAGGLAALYRSRNWSVKFVSVTDGAAGHQTLHGAKLVQRRRAEAQAAGAVIGAEYQVWDLPDGRLEVTLAARERIVREVRQYAPDLIVTHRPFDYHPDHRAVGQLVMDAAYLLTVPAFVPDVPALARPPVIASFCDLFLKPVRFEPHVVIDVEAQIPTLVSMLHCHASQVYDWLPFNRGVKSEVPDGESQRLAWLEGEVRKQLGIHAERFRQRLVEVFGERGHELSCIEAFEISEYGRPLDALLLARLFPWHAAVV